MIPESNLGGLDVLNAKAGHLELKFSSEEDCEIACKAVVDMLRAGYSLFVHNADGTLSRVKHFDPKHRVYVVMETQPEPETAAGTATPPAKKRGRPRKVPAETAKVTAVGRTAGG